MCKVLEFIHVQIILSKSFSMSASVLQLIIRNKKATFCCAYWVTSFVLALYIDTLHIYYLILKQPYDVYIINFT